LLRYRIRNFADWCIGRLLAAHSTDNNLELFLVCTDKEIQKRLARKAKRERKRTGSEIDPVRLVATVQEQFRRLKAVRAGGKVKSIAVRIVKKSSCRVLMALGKQIDYLHFNHTQICEKQFKL
jgi:hypothetical protein